MENGLPWDGPLASSDSTSTSRLVQQHADGRQAGGLSHKAALPPLVSFGLEMSEHFDKCKDLLREPTPLEQEPVLDDDLKFAAASMASHYMGSWQTSERGQSERARSWAANGIQSPTT